MQNRPEQIDTCEFLNLGDSAARLVADRIARGEAQFRAPSKIDGITLTSAQRTGWLAAAIRHARRVREARVRRISVDLLALCEENGLTPSQLSTRGLIGRPNS